MRILPFFAFLIFVVMGAVSAPAETLREKWQERRAERGAMADSATLPQGTQLQKDIAYGTHEKQKIDVYIPAKARQAPILLMVHGGAWITGDKTNPGVVGSKAPFWLPKGYIIVSANYRMVGDGADPLVQAQDIARALAFVQKNAASWDGDPLRVVLMGHSAGAHLVGLLSVNPVLAAAEGAQEWRGSVMLDSGAIDVVTLMSLPHAGFYDKAFGEDPAFWHKVSLTAQLSGGAVPLLMACSSTRKDKPCLQAEALAARMRQNNLRAEVLPQALSHGEMNAALGKPGAYTDQVDLFIQSLIP